jgi:hypothetical protein
VARGFGNIWEFFQGIERETTWIVKGSDDGVEQSASLAFWKFVQCPMF